MPRHRLPALVLSALLALGATACAGDSTVEEGPLEPGGGEASPNTEELEGDQSAEQNPGGGIPDENENAVDG